MQFEWNADKAERNLKGHKVSFREAATVFDDPLFITFIDEDHSTQEEERYITIGLSDLGKLLMVAHTDRGERIRIISARKATNNERRFYEQGL